MVSAEVALAQRCATGCQLYDYQSSISSDANGPLDLKAFAFFPRDLTAGANAPVAVVMHGYSPQSTFGEFRPYAEALANNGFVAVLVAMRGRDGSDGVRDSGGLEIYDIYDAVEHLKADAFFAPRIDETNIHITGYSGGGGNVMSALTKFPDYFRLGSAYYGMSDYGFDPADGWYVHGANVGANRTAQLDADVGDPTTRDAATLDRYLARASNLASKNNPLSEIHLFVNNDEEICPPVNSITYRDNAVAAATATGEFDKITLHLGDSSGQTWVDHDGDDLRDANETQSFPHSGGLDSQIRGEAWYLQRLKAGAIPAPVLNDQDEFFVAGWVKTSRFELFLGDGQNAAGTLDYELSDQRLEFHLDIESSDLAITGRLSVDASRLSTPTMLVQLNGVSVDTAPTGVPYVFGALGNGDTLRLLAVPEPVTGALSSTAVLGCLALRARRSDGRHVCVSSLRSERRPILCRR